MAFTGGAVVVKMRDFSSKGSVGDVQEVVGVDVVRQRTVGVRDKQVKPAPQLVCLCVRVSLQLQSVTLGVNFRF